VFCGDRDDDVITCTQARIIVTFLMSPVRIDPHSGVLAFADEPAVLARFLTGLQMLLPRKSLHSNSLRVALTTDPMSAY